MFTIKSTAPDGLVLGYYGTFDSLDTARFIADRVTRLAHRDHDSVNSYTAVVTPEDVTPKYLHPRYLA